MLIAMQEFSSQRAVSWLSDQVQARTRVVRLKDGSQQGIEMEICQKDVVPGDVITFSSGNL
jgi:magnesium-transporting ATPase (P-type)